MSADPGECWDVITVDRVTDGDTVRMTRSMRIEIDGRHYKIIDDEPKGFPIRLVWIDTPERGQDGYSQARDDLAQWITMSLDRGPLHVYCYESGGWDRIMGDLINSDGQSASQYMMIEKGWLPYVKGQ